MSSFNEYYARLHDDELIHLALTRELTPEAADALKTELQSRGISDLTSHEQLYRQEVQAEEIHRTKQLSTKRKIVRWRTWFLCLCAASMCARGVFLSSRPNPERPGEDGGLFIVLGVAVFLFAWATSFFSRLWSERVVHRKPPT